MIRKKKSILGLDLGSQVFKAVEITLEGGEPVITGFSRLELGPSQDRRQAIGELMQLGRFGTRNVVSSVAGQSVVVRYVNMVPMSDSELRQAIQFESDKYLPFDLSEVVLDCQRLQHEVQGAYGAGGGKQMSVVLAACQKGIVAKLLDDITSHGLTASAVDIDAFALANAYELTHRSVLEGQAADVAVALVDMGAVRTQINVLRGGETCFSREIGMGGNDMSKAIARRLNLDQAGAEALKRDPGERLVEVQRAIAPVLEDLVSELSLSMDFVESREGVRIEEVLFSGGAALAPGALENIGKQTGRQTRFWNPLQGLSVDADHVDVEEIERNASFLAVAVGLAARAKA